MSCSHCKGVTIMRIGSPRDLKRAIKLAAEAVRSGTLRYVGAGQWGEPFINLAAGGRWGDFVTNYFACPSCGHVFHLHAETYHGSGGAFEPVTEVIEKLQDDAFPR